MTSTKINDTRLRELEAIELKKSKMPKVKLIPVTIDYHTTIWISKDKDPDLAAENFRQKVKEAYNKQFYKG